MADFDNFDIDDLIPPKPTQASDLNTSDPTPDGGDEDIPEIIEDAFYAGDQDPTPIQREVWAQVYNRELDSPNGRTLVWSAGILSEIQNKKPRPGCLTNKAAVPLNPARFAFRIEEMTKWHRGRDKNGDVKYTRVPTWLVQRMMAVTEGESLLPNLQRIVHTPVFTPAGKLLITPGYDDESGIYYAPHFACPEVPDFITDARLAQAREFLLTQLIPDFPFEDQSSRAHAIALLVLPFVREMIKGPTPLHSIDAALQSSGKSLLMKTLIEPAFGADDTPGGATMPRSEDEFRKKLTSTLVARQGIFVMDNVKMKVESEVLAAALTGGMWNDRLMGGNQIVQCKLDLIWVMTANCPALDADGVERTLRITLVPPTDSPADRDVAKFTHPNHEQWTRDHRPEIVQAALILIQNWIQHGRPESKRKLSKFLDWSLVIGGILDAAGIPGFLDNYVAKRDEANTERQSRGDFCNRWWELQIDRPGEWKLRHTAGELWEFAKNIEDLTLKGNNEQAMKISLGLWLKDLAAMPMIGHIKRDDDGRPLSKQEFKIHYRGIKHHAKVWEIQLLREIELAPKLATTTDGVDDDGEVF